MKPHLFHVIADAGSADARRVLVELALESAVRLRNLHYPEVEADFVAFGGKETPALWDGTTLVSGGPAVVAALHALKARLG